jgi:hypothetical protein
MSLKNFYYFDFPQDECGPEWRVPLTLVRAEYDGAEYDILRGKPDKPVVLRRFSIVGESGVFTDAGIALNKIYFQLSVAPGALSSGTHGSFIYLDKDEPMNPFAMGRGNLIIVQK